MIYFWSIFGNLYASVCDIIFFSNFVIGNKTLRFGIGIVCLWSRIWYHCWGTLSIVHHNHRQIVCLWSRFWYHCWGTLSIFHHHQQIVCPWSRIWCHCLGTLSIFHYHRQIVCPWTRTWCHRGRRWPHWSRIFDLNDRKVPFVFLSMQYLNYWNIVQRSKWNVSTYFSSGQPSCPVWRL